MLCPSCKSKTNTTSSVVIGNETVRGRQCEKCNLKFRTIETTITNDLYKVLIRDIKYKGVDKTDRRRKMRILMPDSIPKLMYQYLSKNSDRAISYEELAENVWLDPTTKNGTIRMAAIEIRSAFGVDTVKNIVGFGYKWNEPE